MNVVDEELYPQGLAPHALGFRKVRYEKADGVARVTIDRPDVYNCLNFQTLRELTRAFEDASWDDEVAVLVLTGAGDKAFCTGADLREQEGFLSRPHDYWKWMGAFIEALEKLRRVGKPTVARLNGMVVGGGNEFNMACDLAVMVDDGYIRHVGMGRGSVAAGGATQWLPIMVGDRRAREILYLSDQIDAAKALDWGLVNRVVPRDRLDAEVDAMVAKLKAKLPECTRYTKQHVEFWKDFSWHQTIGHARDWLTLHAGDAETYVGIKAFGKKQPIDYDGLRRRMAEGRDAEYPHGLPDRRCGSCGTEGLPEDFAFCGSCGAKL